MGVDAAVQIAWRVALAFVGAGLVYGLLMLVVVPNIPQPPQAWLNIVQGAGYWLPVQQMVLALTISGASYATAWSMGLARKGIETATAGTVKGDS